jgi:adenylate cyclase class 2
LFWSAKAELPYFLSMTAASHEVEIKFRVADPEVLLARLSSLGFALQTPRTLEINELFDFSDQRLRHSGQVLRIRKYGDKWTLTHKSKAPSERHKVRIETEMILEDAPALSFIFTQIGLNVAFRYEKFRTEWKTSEGHLVLDETPIGTFAELEGPPEWIDRTAEALAVSQSQYIVENYVSLFERWRKQNHSRARNMTWDEITGQK